jgi:hypothetical protein
LTLIITNSSASIAIALISVVNMFVPAPSKAHDASGGTGTEGKSR